MRDFSACSCREGAEGIYTLLSRLTLTYDDSPASPQTALASLCEAMLHGDLLLSDARYHALIRALLSCPARRVSGDLFKDYLMYLIVQKENAFSTAAAAQLASEELSLAMKQDLTALGMLSTLTSADIKRMAQEGYREQKLRPRVQKDNISLMSTAVWSTGSTRTLPKEEPAQPAAPAVITAPVDFNWMEFHYGEEGLRDEFVSDEAGEEIYLRLLSGDNWASLRDDLWNFFASYGCGMFLENRLFSFDGLLSPLPASAAAPLTGELYEAERAEILDNVIRFMRGERAANMLITGDSGVGKSAEIYSLPYELPEVRLISISPGAKGIGALVEKLRSQPLKFLLFFDDIDLTGEAFRSAANELCALNAQSGNVLLAAACHESSPTASALFQLEIYFPCLQLGEFADLVRELAGDELALDISALRAACVDHQVDTRDRLTYAGAMQIAQKFTAMQ